MSAAFVIFPTICEPSSYGMNTVAVAYHIGLQIEVGRFLTLSRVGSHLCLSELFVMEGLLSIKKL